MANTKRKSSGSLQTPSGQKSLARGATCFRCGKEYPTMRQHFPSSQSPNARGTGYAPYCYECVDDMYKYYTRLYGDDVRAMHRVCELLDLYWDESAYKRINVGEVKSPPRGYLQKLNLKSYVGKGYEDYLKEEDEKKASYESPDSPFETVDISDINPDTIHFWGRGLEAEDYVDLEDKFEFYTGKLENHGAGKLSPGEISTYRQICILELQIDRDRAAGKPVEKTTKELNGLLGSANIKPIQSQNVEDNDSALLGMLAKKWESERPIPKTDLPDQSGIRRTVHTYFFGHTNAMLGVKNAYSKMYEEEMARLRIEKPELADEDDDQMLYDIFSSERSDDE